jgi:hypothetical protein
VSAKRHLGPGHPVAEVAARLCAAHLAALARSAGLGGVACGACWERAIRDDERAVVLFGLPREIEPDPSYVDQVAVDRACGGDQVRLTRLEFAEAVRRLTVWGYNGRQAADVLGVDPALVYSVRAGLSLAERRAA